MRGSLVIGFAMTLLLCGLGSAFATTMTLTDQNSTFLVDPSSQAGAYQWVMDGTNQLYQEWFWYRVGSAAQQSIDTVSAPIVSQPDPSILRLTYTGAGFDIKVNYTLTGGPAGSGTSDVSEAITVNNTSGSALDFHLFMYTDFDLRGTPSGDSVQLIGSIPNKALQVDSPVVSDTVVTGPPQEWEAGYYASTLTRLNSGVPITLNDTKIAGPGDVTWAFEWDTVLAAAGHTGSSLIISADKNIVTLVPEPTSLILVGGGLLGLAGLGRKLRAKK